MTEVAVGGPWREYVASMRERGQTSSLGLILILRKMQDSQKGHDRCLMMPLPQITPLWARQGYIFCCSLSSAPPLKLLRTVQQPSL